MWFANPTFLCCYLSCAFWWISITFTVRFANSIALVPRWRFEILSKLFSRTVWPLLLGVEREAVGPITLVIENCIQSYHGERKVTLQLFLYWVSPSQILTKGMQSIIMSPRSDWICIVCTWIWLMCYHLCVAGYCILCFNLVVWSHFCWCSGHSKESFLWNILAIITHYTGWRFLSKVPRL